METLKGHWQLILITVVVFVLWSTLAVFPLKVLVVFMHELSHGLAAVFTGGSIEAISLSVEEGGHAITRGGNRFIILSSGYVGSLVIGVLLLLIAIKTHADRALLGLFGLVMLLVTVLYIRDPFPLAFCSITGLAMLAVAWHLSRPINDFILRIIGLTSVIYVPYDIFSDTIARSELRSDAYMLAEQFGGPTMLWGGLWLVVSLAVIWFLPEIRIRPEKQSMKCYEPWRSALGVSYAGQSVIGHSRRKIWINFSDHSLSRLSGHCKRLTMPELSQMHETTPRVR